MLFKKITLKCTPLKCNLFSDFSSDLVLHFNKVRGLTRDRLKNIMVKIEVAEVKIP